MRTPLIAFLFCLAFTLTSCNIGESPDQQRSAARQAGREAYKATRDLKKDAREAARELRNASKEFREGWSEAQQKDAHRPKPGRGDADRYDSKSHK